MIVRFAVLVGLIAATTLACEPTAPAPSDAGLTSKSGNAANPALAGPGASADAAADAIEREEVDGAEGDEGAEVDAPYAIESGLDSADSAERLLDLESEGDGLDALLRAAADSTDPVLRETAVVALGDSGDPRALDALIAASLDPEPTVVLAALEQLRWSEDRLARDAIRRLRDSPDPAVARAARDAIDD